MSEATATPAPPAAAPNYGRYLKIWLVLLGITVIMVFVHSPGVLVAGVLAKATIIALWFMHLKDETLDFILTMAIAVLGLAAILFFLIMPDGLAM